MDSGKESCLVKSVGDKKVREGEALFLVGGWRESLCRCHECQARYDETGMDFLLDQEDTVHHYESRSKASSGMRSTVHTTLGTNASR